MGWDELREREPELERRLRRIYLDLGCRGPAGVPAAERRGTSRPRAEAVAGALAAVLSPLPVRLEPYRGAYGAYHGIAVDLTPPLPLPPPVAPEKAEWIRRYGGEVYPEAEAIELWAELSEIVPCAMLYWYVWRRGLNAAGRPCRYGDVVRGGLSPEADHLRRRVEAHLAGEGIRVLPVDLLDLTLPGARLQGETAGEAPTVAQLLFAEQ